jgi:hypothetical protein
MGRKKNSPKTAPATPSAEVPALKIGSRVRCTDDQMEGRIVWANAASVKIKWDDGEQVTWKRADLAGKPITILDAEDQPASAEPSEAPAGAGASGDQAQTPAKAKRQRKATKAAKEKKLSALDAAVRVLAETGQPMNCQEMIDAMAAKGYWTSPGGKTPAATLYSAILRELATKGADARFVKTERGKFARKQ